MRKTAVAHNFGLASHHYDAQAGLQAVVAQQLAQAILASHPASGLSVLEIGGGTGGLTRHLLPALCPSLYLFSDLSWPMVRQAKLAPPTLPLPPPSAMTPLRLVMDGELPALPPASVDVVVSSLAVQWFTQPALSLPNLLRLLKPGGQLWISTLVQGSLRQWQRDCQQADLPVGTIPLLSEAQLVALLSDHGHQVEGQVQEMLRPYPSALAFLQNLRAIGAQQPVAGHQPAPAVRLRRLLLNLPQPYVVSYHVWLGCVTV